MWWMRYKNLKTKLKMKTIRFKILPIILLIATYCLPVRGQGKLNAVPECVSPPACPKMVFEQQALNEKIDKFNQTTLTCFNAFTARLSKKLQNIHVDIPAIPSIPQINSRPNFEGVTNCAIPLNSVEKVKKISKTYPVDASDILAIITSYGRINVNTWAKNEIKVDVEIKAYDASDEDAQALLNTVQVNTRKTGKQILFKTEIENKKNKNSSWFSMSFWNNINEKRFVDVNYTVYMPVRNAINFKTNYTNITLPDMDGFTNISMNYGDFTARKLAANSNKIASNYSKIKIAQLVNGDINANYGNIFIEQADILNADLNYCKVQVNELTSEGVFNMNYASGFQINKLDNKFSNLKISSNYSSINLGFNENQNFNFDVSVSYASFRFDNDKVKITETTPNDEDKKGWNSSKNYKGFYGKTGSGSKISINSNYGSVEFR
jgi:hypothetical protein